MIKFLEHNEIDFKLWDKRLKEATNPRIYANSWYLDITAPNWSAIVDEDYKIFMPVVLKKKFFLKYVYHPLFTQQLGIFFVGEKQRQISDFWQESLKILTEKFSYITIQLNYANNFENLTKKTNIVLDLSPSYEKLRKKYKRSQKFSIPKAEDNGLIIRDICIGDFIDFRKKYSASNFPPKHFLTLEKLLARCLQEEKSRSLGVFKGDELLAVGFFAFYGNAYYYLSGASSQRGKQMYASHFLFDSFIKENAGKPYFLDFEGSEIAGVAQFFRGWGGKNIPYYFLKINKLPFPLNKIKK